MVGDVRWATRRLLGELFEKGLAKAEPRYPPAGPLNLPRSADVSLGGELGDHIAGKIFLGALLGLLLLLVDLDASHMSRRPVTRDKSPQAQGGAVDDAGDPKGGSATPGS